MPMNAPSGSSIAVGFKGQAEVYLGAKGEMHASCSGEVILRSDVRGDVRDDAVDSSSDSGNERPVEDADGPHRG